MKFKKIRKILTKKYAETLRPLCDLRLRDFNTEDSEIEDSIGCWIRTRILGISASMACDYATIAQVQELDKLVSDEEIFKWRSK